MGRRRWILAKMRHDNLLALLVTRKKVQLTQKAGFTSTKVQILTQKALFIRTILSPRLTCFASTKYEY